MIICEFVTYPQPCRVLADFTRSFSTLRVPLRVAVSLFVMTRNANLQLKPKATGNLKIEFAKSRK
jgi:hypothetical protein